MGFNGLGFSGGGFGQAGQPGLGAVSQANGVAAYGSVWASSNCPACNTAILDMQVQMARVAGLLGVTASSAADGKVGAGTVSTLQSIGLAANSRGMAWGAQIRTFATPEAVAKNADKIRDILAGASVAAMPTATPPAAYPTGNAGPVMTTTSPASPYVPGVLPNTTPGLVSSIKAKIPTPYLIGGGILLVGAIAAAVILMTPSKAG